MTTTMFLSMWISNTATTAMMVPIVDAVLDELQREEKKNLKSDAAISSESDNHTFQYIEFTLELGGEQESLPSQYAAIKVSEFLSSVFNERHPIH
ncbi:UNVERIFIED_CONTAM: Solute carrier family 13 member 2 [Trichonephila clavipes]